MRAIWMASLAGGLAAVSMFEAAAGREPHAAAHSHSTLRVLLLNPQLIEKTRERIQAGDPEAVAALDQLKREAEDALKIKALTVVDEPTPPSGDKHDFMSLSIYWWPNPDTKDRLPYVHHDGKVNPEVNQYDLPKISAMSDTVQTLALAYYLTRHEPYVQHAARLLHVWFIDETTRMNPNMNHAQAVPGISSGGRQGIIETAQLATKVIDSVELLNGSAAWSDGDLRATKLWFREYLQWLQTHPYALAESLQTNNHGMWYDLQVATFATFVGDEDRARHVLSASTMSRICRQIMPDGRQPEELKRTKSWDYSLYNLDALFALAALGQRLDVDLWGFVGPDGQSVPKALDYLAAYLDTSKKWPHQQVHSFSPKSSLSPFVIRAVSEFHDPRFAPLLQEVDPVPGSRLQLLYPN
jgi:hypothetical protein